MSDWQTKSYQGGGGTVDPNTPNGAANNTSTLQDYISGQNEQAAQVGTLALSARVARNRQAAYDLLNNSTSAPAAEQGSSKGTVGAGAFIDNTSAATAYASVQAHMLRQDRVADETCALVAAMFNLLNSYFQSESKEAFMARLTAEGGIGGILLAQQQAALPVPGLVVEPVKATY